MTSQRTYTAFQGEIMDVLVTLGPTDRYLPTSEIASRVGKGNGPVATALQALADKRFICAGPGDGSESTWRLRW